MNLKRFKCFLLLIFILLPVSTFGEGYFLFSTRGASPVAACRNISIEDAIQCAQDDYWQSQPLGTLGGAEQCEFDVVTTFFPGSACSPSIANLLSNGTFTRTDTGTSVNCTLNGSQSVRKEYNICPEFNARLVDKNRGETCPTNGSNPINSATGNKYQKEQDYIGSGADALSFTRIYNSQDNRVGPFGSNWRHSYSRSIDNLSSSSNLSSFVNVKRQDGNIFLFRLISDVWTPDSDVTDRLIELLDSQDERVGWQYITADDVIEEYDVEGKLISITSRGGMTQVLEYDLGTINGGDDNPETLDSITNAFGRSLQFNYDVDSRIISMTDPAGGVYSYSYNTNNTLVSVTYPDETPIDNSDNPQRIYHYEDTNFPNYLTGITDENNSRFASWAYDLQGRAILSEHNGGAERVEIIYNGTSSSTVTDSLGHVQTYFFENHQGVAKTRQIDGGPCATCGGQNQNTGYDSNGFVISRTDFKGNQTTFINNSRGLQTSRTEAAGTTLARTITTEWHPSFRLPTKITEPGKETTLIYDTNGQLLTRTETDTLTLVTRVTTNAYNALGLIASTDGPRTDVNDITTFDYDAQGNLIKTTNALGQETNITSHNAHGQPLTIIDANNTTTTLTYDARRRLLTRTVDGQTTSFEYDGVGNITKTTLPNGSFLMNEYDAAQRLMAIEDNLGNRIEYTLDSLGNRTQEEVKDPLGTLTRTMSRTYNSLNRLIETIGGENQSTTFAYDANGNRREIIVDPTGLNQKTERAFDALNRLFLEVGSETALTLYSYDMRDNLTSVRDATGLTTTYTYDGLDNLVQQQSPDTGIAEFTYDAAGNRLTQIDARNITSTYTYDVLNRLISISYPDITQNVTYSYDSCTNGVGRLCQMDDESGTTTYSYDARGNLVSQTSTIDGLSQTTSYVYNSSDQLIQITYPSGRTVDYLRNVLGQVDSVTTTKDSMTETLASNLSYQPFGPMDSMDYGNNLIQSKTYDLDYRLSSLTTTNSIQNHSYTLDNANNITDIIDNLNSNQTQTLAYDDFNRLLDANGSYGDLDYSYDLIGNRLSETVDTSFEAYTYDAVSHHLLQTMNGVTRDYTYDANGNTLSNSNRDFTYGDNNRLKEAQSLGTVLATYTYNGRGERVKKVATDTTYYHYDQNGLLLAELDDTGGTQMEYIYLDGQPLALITDSSGGESNAITTETLFSDDFTGNDGDIIDDQANNKWRGKQPRETTTSAIIQTNQARVFADQRITTESTFVDEVNTKLIVALDLIGSGKTTLKKVNTPKTGVRVRFKPSKNKAVVKIGVFNNPIDKTEIDLSANPTQSLHVVMTLENGVATVVLTDDIGTQYTVGPIDHSALDVSDEYRLKLQTIEVGGNKVDATADNVVVVRESEGTPPSGTGDTFFYHNDHLGTPQLITDSNQQVVWETTYTPFGEATITTELITNNIRFPGQYYDEETGLHYNYFRYYDPSLGRYITSDPIGINGGTNTYLYAIANPVIYADVLGLFPGPGGSMIDLPAWIPKWGSGIGSSNGSSSSTSSSNDECDDENEEEEDCLQKALDSYSLQRSIDRITGAGIISAVTGAGAQGINKTAIKPRGGIAGGGPSGRYTSYTRRLLGNGIGRKIGRISVSAVARASGILGAGLGAWSLHGEAFLLYLECLEENQ